MSGDFGSIYVVPGGPQRGTELRCQVHPDWWADADWTVMDAAFERAEDHIKNDHPNGATTVRFPYGAVTR